MCYVCLDFDCWFYTFCYIIIIIFCQKILFLHLLFLYHLLVIYLPFDIGPDAPTRLHYIYMRDILIDLICGSIGDEGRPQILKRGCSWCFRWRVFHFLNLTLKSPNRFLWKEKKILRLCNNDVNMTYFLMNTSWGNSIRHLPLCCVLHCIALQKQKRHVPKWTFCQGLIHLPPNKFEELARHQLIQWNFFVFHPIQDQMANLLSNPPFCSKDLMIS